MYEHGRGVERDDVAAYMWYSLSAELGHEPARVQRDIAARSLSPIQIERAESLALAWHAQREGLVEETRTAVAD
jgi:TPR repeat protein